MIPQPGRRQWLSTCVSATVTDDIALELIETGRFLRA